MGVIKEHYRKVIGAHVDGTFQILSLSSSSFLSLSLLRLAPAVSLTKVQRDPLQCGSLIVR